MLETEPKPCTTIPRGSSSSKLPLDRPHQGTVCYMRNTHAGISHSVDFDSRLMIFSPSVAILARAFLNRSTKGRLCGTKSWLPVQEFQVLIAEEKQWGSAVRNCFLSRKGAGDIKNEFAVDPTQPGTPLNHGETWENMTAEVFYYYIGITCMRIPRFSPRQGCVGSPVQTGRLRQQHFVENIMSGGNLNMSCVPLESV
jgi:hypothetical protein